MIFEAAGMVLMNALLGAGYTRRVMLVSITNQWLVFLPLAYLIGPVAGYGLTAIYLVQIIYRAFQALVFSGFWLRRDWARVRI
jgi:multidrug resistance protein, MATE family